jgi:hypothetical protein
MSVTVRPSRRREPDMPAATFRRTCPRCKRRFEQPNDPGRRRVYCSDACKQAAYRARVKRQREQADRQRERGEPSSRSSRERARQQARAGTNGHRGGPGPDERFDGPEQARARRRIEALLREAASTAFPYEAAACRAKVEELRQRHGL